MLACLPPVSLFALLTFCDSMKDGIPFVLLECVIALDEES